ncbi:MAG: DUF2637 domain-containing protein [Methanospirillaceae archaeon]|nr:DUF2637 domain-containing protein [Methanospirillaceae archaeon]
MSIKPGCHWTPYSRGLPLLLNPLLKSLRSSAVQTGFYSPPRSGSWPICIDALLISGSHMVLRSSVQGSSTLLGWGVLASYTAISTGFTIGHAPEGLLKQASHAIPPIFCSVFQLNS